MKKMTILALVSALAGFGYVGTASAGFTTAVFLDCGDKETECFGGFEWESWLKCGNRWKDDGTEVDLAAGMVFLTTTEIAGDGTCDSAMVIVPDGSVRDYKLGCSLPSNSNKGGNGKSGGRKVSLTVRNVGPEVCDP